MQNQATDEATNPTTLNEVKEKITNENNSITSTTDITNLRVVDLTLEKAAKNIALMPEQFVSPY